jgi:hypothetical protein
MPYKSKSQVRLFHAMEDRGELPKGTAHRWAEHTSDIKSLPEHKKHKKGAKGGKNYPGCGMPRRRRRKHAASLPSLFDFLHDLRKHAAESQTGPLPNAPKLPSMPQAPVPSPSQQPPPPNRAQTPQVGPQALGWRLGQGVVAPQVMQPQGGVQAVLAANRTKVSASNPFGVGKGSLVPPVSLGKPNPVSAQRAAYDALRPEDTAAENSVLGAARKFHNDAWEADAAAYKSNAPEYPRLHDQWAAAKELYDHAEDGLFGARHSLMARSSDKPMSVANLGEPFSPSLAKLTSPPVAQAKSLPGGPKPEVSDFLGGHAKELGIGLGALAAGGVGGYALHKLLHRNKPRRDVDGEVKESAAKHGATHSLGDPYPKDWNGRVKRVRGDLNGVEAWNSLHEINGVKGSYEDHPVDYDAVKQDQEGLKTAAAASMSHMPASTGHMPASTGHMPASTGHMPASSLFALSELGPLRAAGAFATDVAASPDHSPASSSDKAAASQNHSPASSLGADCALGQRRALETKAAEAQTPIQSTNSPVLVTICPHLRHFTLNLQAAQRGETQPLAPKQAAERWTMQPPQRPSLPSNPYQLSQNPAFTQGNMRMRNDMQSFLSQRYNQMRTQQQSLQQPAQQPAQTNPYVRSMYGQAHLPQRPVPGGLPYDATAGGAQGRERTYQMQQMLARRQQEQAGVPQQQAGVPQQQAGVPPRSAERNPSGLQTASQARDQEDQTLRRSLSQSPPDMQQALQDDQRRYQALRRSPNASAQDLGAYERRIKAYQSALGQGTQARGGVAGAPAPQATPAPGARTGGNPVGVGGARGPTQSAPAAAAPRPPAAPTSAPAPRPAQPPTRPAATPPAVPQARQLPTTPTTPAARPPAAPTRQEDEDVPPLPGQEETDDDIPALPRQEEEEDVPALPPPPQAMPPSTPYGGGNPGGRRSVAGIPGNALGAAYRSSNPLANLKLGAAGQGGGNMSSGAAARPVIQGAVPGGAGSGTLGKAPAAATGAQQAKPKGTTTGGAMNGMAGASASQTAQAAQQQPSLGQSGVYNPAGASFQHLQFPRQQSKGTYMPPKSAADLDTIRELALLAAASGGGGAAVGAGLNALPGGEGALRGAVKGGLTGLGGFVGGGLGARAGTALYPKDQLKGMMLGLLGGVGAGGALGNWVGNRVTPGRKREKEAAHDKRALLPIPSWGGYRGSAQSPYGVGLEGGYSHALGLIPTPYAGVRLGGQNMGFTFGAQPLGLHVGMDTGRDVGLSHGPRIPRSIWKYMWDKHKGNPDPGTLEWAKQQNPELFKDMDVIADKPEKHKKREKTSAFESAALLDLASGALPGLK